MHEQWVEHMRLEAMPPVQRWETHRGILREVGLVVRDSIINGMSTTDPGASMLVYNSLARAVAKDDQRTLQRLARGAPLAQGFLVQVAGRWCLKDAAEFNDVIASTRAAELQAKEGEDFPNSTGK